jgi:predicted secreted hydrolase
MSWRAKPSLWLLLLGLLLGGGGVLLWLQGAKPGKTSQTGILLAELLGEKEGFAPVTTPWTFSFPKDHGAHPAYQTESWHFTGHLSTAEGERFGFQVNFFRVGLTPPTAPPRPSAWAAQSVYRGQFALTAVDQNRFQAFERFSRAALGLSGAAASPPHVWLEDWAFQATNSGQENTALRLQARAEESGINLTLRPLKPPLLPGEDAAGEALFHAYQLTRLRAQGQVRSGNRTWTVEGLAWLDRSWGEVPVPAGPVVWDRFLLQLEDEREIVGLRLRRRDGTGTPITRGLLVEGDGTAQVLGREELYIEVLDSWESPRDNVRYPAGWRLRLPSQGIDLQLTPAVADQELNLLLRHWGGMVEITGTAQDRPVTGQGYVELTGYGT